MSNANAIYTLLKDYVFEIHVITPECNYTDTVYAMSNVTMISLTDFSTKMPDSANDDANDLLNRQNAQSLKDALVAKFVTRYYQEFSILSYLNVDGEMIVVPPAYTSINILKIYSYEKSKSYIKDMAPQDEIIISTKKSSIKITDIENTMNTTANLNKQLNRLNNPTGFVE